MGGIQVRAAISAIIVLALMGCSLPRGAALQSEIVKESDANNPSYAVVEVTRAVAAQVRTWPATGHAEGYAWPEATRGPKSQVIRTGDRVNLVIWDSQENSLLTAPAQKVVNMEGLSVSSSGTIFVPYIDEIVVNGQTPDQARKNIQAKLSSVLPAAQVQLTMTAGTEHSVDLVSGVGAPGSYPLPNRDTRILTVLSLASGISERLRNPAVRLMRAGRAYRISASELLSNPARNILVRGGDQVIVEEDDRYFMALGAAGSEQLVYFTQEYVTALEAMSLIGGISDSRANPQGVLILREYPKSALRADGRGPTMTDTIFVIDLTSADGLFAARNFRIYPNDTVLVTESPLTVANTIFGLIGRLFAIEGQVSGI